MRVHFDLIQSSGWQEQFASNGTLVYARCDRSFYVDEIDVGTAEGQTTKDRVHAAAVAAIKSIVPVGTPNADRPAATAREYRVVPWHDHDGAQVIVSYVYDGHGGVDTTYTIECFGGLRQVMTDSEYDDAAGDALIPIEVNYWRNWSDPASENPSGHDPYTATVTDMPVLRPVGGILLTKTISEATATAIEAAKESYLGWTNHAPFSVASAGPGMPAVSSKATNTLLCSECNTIANRTQGTYTARVRWDYMPETWDQWARFRNDQFGVPGNIWRDWGASYANMANSNGFKRCKAYRRANMNALFTLVTS